MEGLTTLRPQLVQALLETCTSIQVKRLFLYMAEKAGHAWFSMLDLSNLEIGKGDRSIVKGSAYIAKHCISVPRELVVL